MTGQRVRRAALASGRQDAGVGDQRYCPHGNADCPDPVTGLPCFECVTEGSA